jgi:hypothetical protein
MLIAVAARAVALRLGASRQIPRLGRRRIAQEIGIPRPSSIRIREYQHGLLLHRTGGLSINLSRCDRPNSWHLSRVVEELLPKPVRLCSLVVSTPSRSMFKAMQTTQVGRIRGGKWPSPLPAQLGKDHGPVHDDLPAAWSIVQGVDPWTARPW